MSFDPTHLPSRVGRRSQHNGFANRTPKSSIERTTRTTTAGRTPTTDNDTMRFLAEIGPRRITGRNREREVEDRNPQGSTRKRIAHDTARLASLSHDANFRSTRNWSAASSRRPHRSRATRNAPNLPQINPERRSRNTSTLPMANHGEICASRRRTTLCGACTMAGLKPGNPRWQNQDAYLISEDLQSNTNQHCFAVLDGHGEVGHLVSQHCREQLCAHFLESDLNMNRSFRVMQQVRHDVLNMQACHPPRQDLNDSNFDVRCSGATCVFMYINGTSLKVANIGDSRGVLGHVHNGSICAIPLTSDHKVCKSFPLTTKLSMAYL